MDGMADVEVHRIHVRKVLTLMREHKLYANLKKCIFAASEIPLLGCIVGTTGVRPDPEKIKAITDWPVPVDVKGLRKFLDLAAYLHRYSRNYAERQSIFLVYSRKMLSGHGTLIVSVPSRVSSKA